jgi:hypothetical protein
MLVPLLGVVPGSARDKEELTHLSLLVRDLPLGLEELGDAGRQVKELAHPVEPVVCPSDSPAALSSSAIVLLSKEDDPNTDGKKKPADYVKPD